jgi:hypothetical protein
MSGYARLNVLVTAAVLLVGSVAGLHAQQPGEVEGRVVNAETGQPIAGAQLQVVGTQRGNMSGEDGTFRITDVPPGEREIRAQFIGFGSQTLTVLVEPDGVATADFELQQTVLDLDQIVVTGVAGETPRAKLPFTVSRVTPDAFVTVASNAASMS